MDKKFLKAQSFCRGGKIIQDIEHVIIKVDYPWGGGGTELDYTMATTPDDYTNIEMGSDPCCCLIHIDQIAEIKELAWRLEDMAASDIAPLKEDDFKVRARINEILDGLLWVDDHI